MVGKWFDVGKFRGVGQTQRQQTLTQIRKHVRIITEEEEEEDPPHRIRKSFLLVRTPAAPQLPSSR